MSRRQRSALRCSDGLCGAEDCPRCFPQVTTQHDRDREERRADEESADQPSTEPQD